MVETVDHAVLAHQSPEIDRKTRSHAVARNARRQHALLVRTGLVAEQSLARDVHHTDRNALGGQQFGAFDQRCDLRTRGDQHRGGFGGIHHHITALSDLRGLLAADGAQRRQGLDVLARQHERHRAVLLDGQFPRHDGLIAVGRTQHEHRTLVVVVAQVLHQADLRLVLHGLVRRAVLAHAERVVRPDVDHMQAHQRREAHGGLHIIGEDEERAADGDHAAVQRHAVHHAGHRQLRDARLEEFTGEIALRERLGLLQKSVGLVRVRQVGRSDDHVVDLLGIDAQHRSRSGARGHPGLHLDGLIVDLGEFARKEIVELARQVLVLGPPRLLDGGLLGGPLLQCLAALGEDLAALLEDGERILRIAAQILHRSGEIGSGGRQRLAVGRNLVLETLPGGTFGTLAHDRTADDERRTLRFALGGDERLADLVDVVSVDRQHVPTPCLVFHGHVLGHHLIDLRRELDVVRVVVHHEVRQAQMAGDAAHALRNLLLDGAVRDIGIGLVRHPLAEARGHETLRDGGAQSHGVPLPQRARGVLHAAQHVHLGVARRHAAPLAQRLQILGRIMSRQRQRRIEHRRHVARIEEEAVTVGISHIVGIVAQEFREEHRDEIGTAHSAAGVARLRLFDHCCRQDADVVGYARQFRVRC